MFYLTCTTVTSVDLAHYGVSRAKDWVSVDCGTRCVYNKVCGPNAPMCKPAGTPVAVDLLI